MTVGMVPYEAYIAFYLLAGPVDRLLTASTSEDCRISFKMYLCLNWTWVWLNAKGYNYNIEARGRYIEGSWSL